MACHHTGGHVIGRRCIGAAGLVVAHVPLRSCEVLWAWAAFAPAGGLTAAGVNAGAYHHDRPGGGAASAWQAPNPATGQPERGPGSQHHEPTAAGGEALPAAPGR